MIKRFSRSEFMIKVLANDGLDFNCKKQLEDLGVDVLDFHYDNES